MTLSWSHKLFLRLNMLHGKRPLLDFFMVFIAHGLVYLVIGGFVFWAWQTNSAVRFWAIMSIAAASYSIGYAMNYSIALVYRHRRPIKELPQVHVLVQTLGTWKSFPSDHAMTSAIPAALVFFFGAPWWVIGSLAVGVLLVAFSRVYVGVHYPRDVVGGLMVGIFSAIVAYQLVV